MQAKPNLYELEVPRSVLLRVSNAKIRKQKNK